MTPIAKRVFLEEIANSAQLGTMLREQFLTSARNEETRQSLNTWLFLQGALIQLGVVSRFLFPVGRAGDEAKARGLWLRTELAVAEESAVNNRDARDALEHFDERLDAMLHRGGAGVLQAVLQSREEFAYFIPERYVFRRIYLESEDIFITMNRDLSGPVEMPLGPAFDELSRIYAAADDLLMTKYALR